MLLFAGIGDLIADVTRVEALYTDSFALENPLLDRYGVALTAGTIANGDGAIIQIGYFEGLGSHLLPSAYSDAEWESFRPLTGLGSPNTDRHASSIGDTDSLEVGPFGFFFYPYPVAFEFDPVFDLGLPEEFPARLGIRFYDGATMEGSSAFNTVSSDDDLWILRPPEASPSEAAVLNMDEHAIVWQSGGGGAFQTTILMIPEPASGLLVLAGIAFPIFRRVRRPR